MGKDFFQQTGGRIIIELTDMNDICVRERISQTNTVRHEGQYRSDSRSIFGVPDAGPGRGRSQYRTYNNNNDNPVPMHHGRPPQRHMEPAYSTPVLHLQFIPLQVSEQQLFNIFTLYGNVVKIMFLDPGHNGKRTSLLEMGSIRQANNAQIYLDEMFSFRSLRKIVNLHILVMSAMKNMSNQETKILYPYALLHLNY